MQTSAPPLRVVLITQDDPFYLAKSFERFFKELPPDIQVVGCVLLSPSPFGRPESFVQKARKTLSIFGLRFFLFYSAWFLISRLNPRHRLRSVLARWRVPVIQLQQSINHPTSLELIRDCQADVLVSVAGNQIFRRPLIELAPRGCLNLHSSLLPKYRGLLPSFWVLKNGEATSGVSVFFVDDGIDTGPILIQKTLSLAGMSQRDLINASKRLGMEAVEEALIRIRDGRVEAMENRDIDATYFRFPTAEDVRAFRRAGARFF